MTRFTQPGTEFDILKTRSANINLQDGVYVYFDQPVRVELLYSDVEALDFLFPNGDFDAGKFELISYT